MCDFWLPSKIRRSCIHLKLLRCLWKYPQEKMGSDYFSSGAQELHVLAVDDSLVDRKIIEKLFRFSCCKVTAVESGRRALQYLGLDGERSSIGFDEMKVNLIMTDYSMPGMTGYELLKKIKGSSRLRGIPVVVMSSENILARIDRCMEEGAKDFLVKPVRLSDVERLRDFIMRGEEMIEGPTQKRKRREESPSPPPSSASSQSSLDSDHPSSPVSSVSDSTHHPPHLKCPRIDSHL